MSLLHHPLSLFLLQLLVILVAARGSGWVMRRVGQPAVVGEIIAGVMLGPSVFGAAFPAAAAAVFEKASLPPLALIGEFGLLLFMCSIGLRFDAAALRDKGRNAVMISVASIALPFVLGVALSGWLYRHFAAPGTSAIGFTLFTGIAMSITAFPVLARILKDKGMEGSRIGALAMACAAADDVIAWSVLACITAIINAQGIAAAALPVVLGIVFTTIMLLAVKPLVENTLKRRPGAGSGMFPVAIIFMLGAAFITDAIGLHALFGAFLAGVIIPASCFDRSPAFAGMEAFVTAVLLPVFFAITGLRLNAGLLHRPLEWLACALICALAVLGKIGGTALAARLSGESLRDSLTLGALMNTRGLMQLIVLNVGYDLHIIPPSVYAMMVMMAIVTTMMTTPLLRVFKHK